MDTSTSFSAANVCPRCIPVATVVLLGAAILLIASGCKRTVAPVAATPATPAAAAIPAVVPASSEPSATVAPAVPAPPGCLIAGSAIGPLQLGLSLEHTRRRMPQATFIRASDGEGVALVEVVVGGASLALLYAGEEDPEKPVDMTRQIEFLETFNPACATADGIHPGSTLEAAEASYGTLVSISRSEIESREYIQFKHPPAGLQFRLDYSGEFAEGQSETSRYAPGAKIFSISISTR